MFGKLFASMYDGSLHGHWQATVTLQQFVILSNRHGEVDMTAEAIAARTGIPLPILTKGIEELERPDPQSRGPAEEGRRIVRLSPARSWGWRIVNYLFYRSLANAEDKREGARERQRRHRNSAVTNSHAASRSSRHAEAEAKGDAKAKANPKQARVEFLSEGSGLPSALPLEDGREALLALPYIAELELAYPAVDVKQELREMRQWLVGNPTKRKTASGILRFVTGWLKGEQEAAEKRAREARGARESDSAYARELEAARRGKP